MKTFLLLLLSVQLFAQDCCFDPTLLHNDTAFVMNDYTLLLLEQPTKDKYDITITFKKKEPIVTTVEDFDTKINYTGTWYKASGTWGSVSYSSVVNDYLTYQFLGNKIEVIADKAANHGNMGVTVNSDPEIIVNLYSATRVNGVTVFSKGDLPGFSTIKIRVISNTVLIDKFIVTQ